MENDSFDVLSRHGGLDHGFKHASAAIANFVRTLFLAYGVLSCFWPGNVKVAVRQKIGTLRSQAEERRRRLGAQVRAPWSRQRAQAP